MRKSGMALGLIVAVCAFGVSAASALAFGKFHAEIKGRTISEAEPGSTGFKTGEVEKLHLGPYTIECPKGLKGHGMVASEESESFFQEVRFHECITKSKPIGGGEGFEEIKKVNFTLAMEFLSDGSAKAGEGESELRVVKPSVIALKISGTKCVVEVPSQSVPMKPKEGEEYEFAVPETQEEELTNPHAIEKYGPTRDRLGFLIHLDQRLKSRVKPNSRCPYQEESEEGKFNPETGYVEFEHGTFNGSIEGVTLKEGNLRFEE